MLGGELTGDKTSKERTDFFPDQQQNQAHVIDSTRRSERSRRHLKDCSHKYQRESVPGNKEPSKKLFFSTLV